MSFFAGMLVALKKLPKPVASGKKEPYSPERVALWRQGKITLAELDGLSDTDLIKIANIGYSLLGNSQLEDAAIIFRGLIAMDPHEPYFRCALGTVYMASKKYEEAFFHLKEAIRLDPSNMQARINRGEVNLLMGRVKDAISDWNTVIEREDGKNKPFAHRARAMIAIATKTA